jgi:hypothetical protein
MRRDLIFLKYKAVIAHVMGACDAWCLHEEIFHFHIQVKVKLPYFQLRPLRYSPGELLFVLAILSIEMLLSSASDLIGVIESVGLLRTGYFT